MDSNGGRFVLNSVCLPKHFKLTTKNNRNKNDTMQFCQEREKLISLFDYIYAHTNFKS